MKRGGLGRGLDVLLPQSGELLETVVRDISIDEIDPNASQPRRDFDKEALEQLADSIREAGVLSPILVVENGMRYRIVAGERRYRAARLAGLETVPCIVRSMTNEQQMEAALIENLQRQDLNPIEEAAAIRSLMQECGYTQEQAARKLGKSRPAIANALRLLNLPKAVTDLVVTGDLSAGHARVLAGLDSEARQLELAHQCVLHGYSVRRLEELAKARPAVRQAAPKREAGPELMALQNAMREALGLKTTLSGTETRGKITLSYNSAQELEHLYEVIGRLLG
ncbi:MAG: ParB/RepB/Spo0J family partition protein [Christensenellales bacterium]|jgi:ParB family transcriptional regulator, chromosome partitioning protein|nr:ParB/RepB/Spo0J family partition protein [Christensenellaceae bacterium]MBS5574213.1 ParB/RepB/Spo0J family partition protein [Clostridiales bacterium]MEE1440002.1 ParB/RepB/Spo0J family partition protein [Christensenellales bacterium]